jgi:hypothetical protein
MSANDQDSCEFTDDQMMAESFAPMVNDAPFGGIALGGADGAFDPHLGQSADLITDEHHGFAENEFWDQAEDHHADPLLPTRVEDLSPAIPVATPGTKSGNGQAAAPPPVPRRATAAAMPAPPKFTAALAPAVHRRRIPWRPILASTSMVLIAALIWFGIPTRTTIQGRLTYLHTAAAGTPEWQEFEADQRRRLADPSLIPAALQNLQSDHPNTTPGFLQAGSPSLASIIQSSRFDNGMLLLTFRGKDAGGDTQRLTAVLKALYQNDGDLISAVNDARSALADWEPRVASRRAEMDELERRMAQQQQIIDAAKGHVDTDASLAAAFDAGRKYMDSLHAIENDQFRLDELNARAAAASALPAAPSTRPTTQPMQTDRQLAELQRQIDALSDEVSALSSTGGEVAMDAARSAVADARKQQDALMKSTAQMLRDHSDINAAVLSAIDLQNRVGDLVKQLFVARQSLEKLQEMVRLIDQTSRRRQRVVENGDPQLRQLLDQLDAVQRQIAAETAAQPATSQPTIAFSSESDHRFDDVLNKISLRQRKLTIDDNARLRDHLDRLMDDFTGQLRQQRQLVVDTLNTLMAGLQASSVPSDMSYQDKESLSKLMQAIENLAQSESDYATAASQTDVAGQTLASDQQQLAELKELAAERQKILAAANPPTTAPSETRTAALESADQLTAALANDNRAMDAAGSDFADKSMAAVSTGLTVSAAAKAQETLTTLTEAHDSRSGDLTAMQRSRDDLAQRLDTAVDLKQPSEADVTVISDNQPMKLTLLLISLAGIGAFFAWRRN